MKMVLPSIMTDIHDKQRKYDDFLADSWISAHFHTISPVSSHIINISGIIQGIDKVNIQLIGSSGFNSAKTGGKQSTEIDGRV